ncbi:YecR family lipoprotein [Methylococcus geothermalis]|uniref:Lipoprotein n=1 Tax=Methylococcus geothermalis TaxID=2681310 RepID=A0A858QB20_9GAMM|nr:hypothetical protein GNH96_13720 [Methylococcus geothermalis]
MRPSGCPFVVRRRATSHRRVSSGQSGHLEVSMCKWAVVWTVALLLGIAGCAVRKDWFATGGSRADGTVQLSYTWRRFEQPVVDGAQGVALATSRCAAWGYSGA